MPCSSTDDITPSNKHCTTTGKETLKITPHSSNIDPESGGAHPPSFLSTLEK